MLDISEPLPSTCRIFAIDASHKLVFKVYVSQELMENDENLFDVSFGIVVQSTSLLLELFEQEHLSFFFRPTTAPPSQQRGGGAFSLGRGAAFTPAR